MGKSRKPVLTLLFLAAGIAAGAQNLCRRIPVIFAEFQDSPFSITEAYADSVLRVCEKYFKDNLGPSDSIVFTPVPGVRLSEAQDGANISLAVAEACRLAAPFVRYADFDGDGDGNVDCVTVIFSGERIWPRQHTLNEDNVFLSAGGKNINRHIAMSEFFEGMPFGTGLICHETGHAIGLSDLYDTDAEGSGGVAKGLWGSTGLMDNGNRNDSMRTPCGFGAPDYHLLGLGVCDTLKVGEWNLEPVSENHRYLWFPADIAGEYYLFECRKAEGWDRYIGGSGMLIYHMDRSKNRAGYSTWYDMTLTAEQRWTRKQVNCRPDHQCADLVEAYPDADTVSAVFFPYTSGQIFASDTDPAFRFWSGNASRLALRNIRLESDSSVSFSVIEPVKDSKEYVFQESATLSWEFDRSLIAETDSCVAVWTKGGEELSRTRIPVSSTAKAYLTMEKLEPNTHYDIDLFLYTASAVYSSKRHITTKVSDRRNTIPFIFFGDADRDGEGHFRAGSAFPLHIWNAHDVEEIRWTFNGKAVSFDEEGLFVVDGNGTLRAEVFYGDGTCDIISKEIIVL